MTWEKFCELNDVPKRYRIASIETLTIPDQDGVSFKEVAKKMVSSPFSALLLGKAGRGKTHFLYSILRGFLSVLGIPLYDIRYFRATDLDHRLLEEGKLHGSAKYFIKDMDCGFLFIDDFGLGRTSESAERDYYDLLDRRVSHEMITIISSNLSEEMIKDVFGERIDSRLKSFSILEFKGADLRNV